MLDSLSTRTQHFIALGLLFIVPLILFFLQPLEEKRCNAMTLPSGELEQNPLLIIGKSLVKNRCGPKYVWWHAFICNFNSPTGSSFRYSS